MQGLWAVHCAHGEKGELSLLPPLLPSPTSSFALPPPPPSLLQMRFRTAANTYLRAGGVYPSVDAKFPTIDITASAADPATVFTVSEVAGESAIALVRG